MRKNNFFVLMLVCLFASKAFADSGSWGALAAKKDATPTIQGMLHYALQDEYLARAEYNAIMTKFNVTRPFSNIKEAEDRHIAWLKDMYSQYGLEIIKDESTSFVVAPSTLQEAYELGIKAEIENIAMYESFLASDELAKGEHTQLKNLFLRLKKASENHLAAFKRQ